MKKQKTKTKLSQYYMHLKYAFTVPTSLLVIASTIMEFLKPLRGRLTSGFEINPAFLLSFDQHNFETCFFPHMACSVYRNPACNERQIKHTYINHVN